MCNVTESNEMTPQTADSTSTDQFTNHVSQLSNFNVNICVNFNEFSKSPKVAMCELLVNIQFSNCNDICSRCSTYLLSILIKYRMENSTICFSIEKLCFFQSKSIKKNAILLFNFMKLELTLSNDTSVMQDTNSIDKQFSAKSTCDNKSSKNIIHLRIDNVKWFLRPVTRLPFRYQSRACFISKPMSKGLFSFLHERASDQRSLFY